MAPLSIDALGLRKRLAGSATSQPTRGNLTTEGGFLEAWAQGYNVGSLIILILIVCCNYRSARWLHKLILLELFLAIWHGTFIFLEDPNYGWYLSATATLLFISYFLHNVVSWLKIRPFLPLWASRLFIISLVCVQPFWVVEAWSNFEYFNNLGSKANIRTRPWEALLRDPWWVFTTVKLVLAIKKTYGFKVWTLICINRRFGVMLTCMALSIMFLVTDFVVSFQRTMPNSGINPYWRLALVFKCASDTIFLDDFKSVLDDIVARKFSSIGDSTNRKRPRSTSIERSTVPKPASLSAHPNEHQTQPRPKKSRRFRSIIANHKPHVATIQVQQATAEIRKPSYESWNSEVPMLPRPPNTVYRNPELRASESDGSLFIGRLS